MSRVAEEAMKAVRKCVEVGECCACVGLGGSIGECGGW